MSLPASRSVGVESKSDARRYRQAILVTSFGLGIISMLGAVLFLVTGAGTYGSPLAGDIRFNLSLLAVVLFGPLAILLCSVVETRAPTLGAAILCASTLGGTLAAIVNNYGESGFLVYNVATVMLSISLPIFLLGSLLWHSGKLATSKPASVRLWWGLFAVLIAMFGFLLVTVLGGFG